MRNYDELQIWAGADYAVNDVLTMKSYFSF